ncbi:MAG TPA: hypothetical protein VKA79_04770 [Aestuariivirgaceae bacterium]|nr:hypothetical protein [Aestuariivirgaceae bacterium]
MSNERNSQRTAVLLFAVAVIIAVVAAFFTTVERIDTRTASNVAPSGDDRPRQAKAPAGALTGPAALRQLTDCFPMQVLP